MNLQEKIGRIVIELRKEKQVSQETISNETGIGRHYMSDIENGKRNLSLEVVERLCKYFGVTLSEFFKKVENIK